MSEETTMTLRVRISTKQRFKAYKDMTGDTQDELLNRLLNREIAQSTPNLLKSPIGKGFLRFLESIGE